MENLNLIKRNKKTTGNTVYKKLLVLASTKVVACLLASDFPSENPRPQTRNFPYTNTLAVIKKNENFKIHSGIYSHYNYFNNWNGNLLCQSN